ncbi:MAG TPA: MFS transporter [Terriglobales bacterium]|nr:MFS transporter [Terriglobales bacterium]
MDRSSQAAPAGTAVEAAGLDRYLILLFLLLSTATLFDGFDAAIMSLAAPDIRASLDIPVGQWGYIFGICRLGMVASFLFLLYADSFGRRTATMLTVVGFTLFTGLTALATDKWQFTLFQFLARIFLTAEYALAVIMVSEEFPARLRGRAIAVLTSLATLGVVLIAKLQPYILVQGGQPGNWLHASGSALVAAVQSALGLEVDHANWRVLYLFGVAPLVLVFVLRFGMRETRRFEALSIDRPRRTWSEHWQNARRPWQKRYRRRTLIVTILWNCVHLVTAPAIGFWVIYAREKLLFDPFLIGDIVFWAYLCGIGGHFLAGVAIDRIGRKPTCAIFYVLASFAIMGLFQSTSVAGQYFWQITTVFCFLAAGTATHVYASELFPTEIRATGYGWTTNLFGRIMEVATPLLVGTFVESLGISWSVTLLAFGPIVGAVVVMLYAPETRGLTLEEIETELGEALSGD